MERLVEETKAQHKLEKELKAATSTPSKGCKAPADRYHAAKSGLESRGLT